MTFESEEEETELAAEEAGAIGGATPEYANDEGDPSDEADRVVEEAGGGESEGFEQAEDALERYASHEEPGGNPASDAFDEPEDSDIDPQYGEADDAQSPGDDE